MYIDCLAKSNRTDAAEQAETVLRTMKQKYEAGEKQLKPTVVTYSAVIVAWSRTRNNPNAVPRVEALLEEMKSAQSLSPDVQSINGVLRTIAYSKLPDKLQRTEKVIQWMKESGLRPDHHTKQAVAKYQGILF
uniref:Pentacotripeptide-repeat region of PRORP domain-containing protein n=1 Tax=Craspedostauros australis TaxID=1486917 RepID=A0A7R9ZIJ2_9STRA